MVKVDDCSSFHSYIKKHISPFPCDPSGSQSVGLQIPMCVGLCEKRLPPYEAELAVRNRSETGSHSSDATSLFEVLLFRPTPRVYKSSSSSFPEQRKVSLWQFFLGKGIPSALADPNYTHLSYFLLTQSNLIEFNRTIEFDCQTLSRKIELAKTFGQSNAIERSGFLNF